MSDPRPRVGLPASQRRQAPIPLLPEQTAEAPVVQPDTEPMPLPEHDQPRPAQTGDDEHPRCWACGWLLHTSITGDLYCLRWACAQRRQVVGTLVADRAASDRLREAIHQASGEQRERAQEPPSD